MEPSLFDRYLYWLGIDSFPFSARAPVKIMVGPFFFFFAQRRWAEAGVWWVSSQT
jgi:hypothetical protein